MKAFLRNSFHLPLLFLLLLPWLTGCLTTPLDTSPKSRVEVRVDGEPLDDRTWLAGASLGQEKPAPGAQGQKEKPAEQPEPLIADEPDPELPFLKFGPDIFVDEETGEITKLYSVPLGMGAVVSGMFKPTAVKPFLQRIIGKHKFKIEHLPANMMVHGSITGPLQYGRGAGKVQAFNDLLVVTSSMEGLERFERAFNLLFTTIPQVDIAVKIVETTFQESFDIGVTKSGTSPTIERLKSPEKMLIRDFTANFPNAAGLGAPNQNLISEGLFTIGGIHNDWQLRAVLEALQNQERSEIISKPHVTVRNGGVAEVSTLTQQPYPLAKISGNNIATSISFKPVGVKLLIRPSITGTDTVMLSLDVKVDTITAFEETDPVRTPVLSTRSAKTDVFVRNGQTVAIAGLVTERELESESKVPLLGDIPLLGMLFRSTYKEKRKNEVIFFITPKIMRKHEAAGFEPLIKENFLELE